MTFQASDDREHYFLNFLDKDSNPLELSTVNGRPWLKYFGHFSLLCTRAIRVIVNHVLIREYRLRFFPRKDIMCPCDKYPIETRHYILYDCKKFNNYWNPRKNSIVHFILFLKFNSNAFSFTESFT